MKHLLKGLAFFVGFNAIIAILICWYNFLMGNGFNIQNLSADVVEIIVIIGFLFGGGGGLIVYLDHLL